MIGSFEEDEDDDYDDYDGCPPTSAHRNASNNNNNQDNDNDDMNLTQLIDEAIIFGPEQSAVYSREFAQAAAGCCPNGFCLERKIRKLSLEKLIEMKKKAEIDTQKAYEELKHARDKAAIFSDFINDQQKSTFNKTNTMIEFVNDNNNFNQNDPNMLPDDGAYMATILENDGILSENSSRPGVVTQSQSFASKGSSADDDHPSSTTKNDPIRRSNSALSKAKLRKRVSIEEVQMPTNMSLEAELFRKRIWDATSKQSTIPKKNGIGTGNNASDSFSSRSSTTPTTGNVVPARLRAKTTGEFVAEGSYTTMERNELLQQLSKAKSGSHTHTKGLYLSNQDKNGCGTDPNAESNDNRDTTQVLASEHTHISDENSNRNQIFPRDELRVEQHAEVGNEKNTSVIDTNQVSFSNSDDETESQAQLRYKENAQRQISSHQNSPWTLVQSIVNETFENQRERKGTELSSTISTGAWEVPDIQQAFKGLWRRAVEKADKAADEVARDSTYAVVTFTSRQAAVAARACVADGRGHGRWMTLRDIPIPPLADAPAGDIGLTICRNCCRPVTISLNDQQKKLRNYFCTILLAFIYIFYTIPLTLAAQFVAPETLTELFPNIQRVELFKAAEIMSGMLTAAIWSTFFATCPTMFRAIANFGSKATSDAQAEFSALHYYWWFMVLTAFSGNTLANMGLKGIKEGIDVSSDFRSVLVGIAQTIPTVIAVSWLNWIIMRLLIILPLNYLLQINSFVYQFLGMPCLSRVMRGGGPGGPVPYRIYIDSGMVFLCLHALAPVSPIIAPACFFYFLFCQPLLRRNLIFVYRPSFDGGGHRWPFIFTVCISSLIVGEILLTAQMALKQATGPTIVCALSIIPTLLFASEMHRRYYKSFEDAALCQTSMLDGWYDDKNFKFEQREAFRRFLVDAHKASYVPVCLASPVTDDVLTAEPAVVIPKDDEEMVNGSSASMEVTASILNMIADPEATVTTIPGHSARPQQHGATFRRSSNVINTLRGLHRSRLNSASEMMLREEIPGCVPETEHLLNRGMVRNISEKSD